MILLRQGYGRQMDDRPPESGETRTKDEKIGINI